MRLLILAACVAVSLGQAPAIRQDLRYGTDELVEYINGLGTTWQAGHNARFRGVSNDVIRGMMGVKWKGPNRDNPVQTNYIELDDDDLVVPEAFDSRTNWPECPTLKEVRDQSACGSCWAFGACEAMSDRICIASKGKVKVHLSTDDLLSCCKECGDGCDGGDPLDAWQYWVDKGLVTGGTYTSHAGCRPYPFPPCEHHNNRTRLPPCKKQLYPTPSCQKSCQTTYGVNYVQDKHFGAEAYAIPASVAAIQKEVMTHGPIESAFDVYEDFMHYTGGVYQHHAGRVEGGHAVKIIGWGKENGVPYWIVANSWNTDWGEGGERRTNTHFNRLYVSHFAQKVLFMIQNFPVSSVFCVVSTSAASNRRMSPEYPSSTIRDTTTRSTTTDNTVKGTFSKIHVRVQSSKNVKKL